jgi:hypothetical protein
MDVRPDAAGAAWAALLRAGLETGGGGVEGGTRLGAIEGARRDVRKAGAAAALVPDGTRDAAAAPSTTPSTTTTTSAAAAPSWTATPRGPWSSPAPNGAGTRRGSTASGGVGRGRGTASDASTRRGAGRAASRATGSTEEIRTAGGASAARGGALGRGAVSVSRSRASSAGGGGASARSDLPAGLTTGTGTGRVGRDPSGRLGEEEVEGESEDGRRTAPLTSSHSARRSA